jgi:hypothetical protein
MKITGPETTIQPGQVESPTPDTPGRSLTFGNMLQEAMDHSDATGPVQKPAPLSEPLAIQGSEGLSFKTADFAQRTSRAIDLLDSYTNALAAPHKTLRDIEPELKAFVSEAQSLYEDYRETPHDDPQFDAIMEELLRAARLEELRFQRGDYLDT